MTHPISLTRPLLIHVLAAALLCPVAFAKTKSKQEPVKSAAATVKPAAAGTASTRSTKTDASAAAVKTNAADKTKTNPGAKSTATVKPAPADKPAPPAAAAAVKPPPQRQTQGDAPPEDPEFDHRALIVPPTELRSRVPASGPLYEEDCILLAIANSPVLHRRRADIQSAIADRQAEKDWENPELRLSYGSQNDNFIRNPYVERTVENLTETEDHTSTQTTTSLANPGEFGFGESTVDQETGTTNTTRFREIERIVTPGRYGDTVTTNIFERRVITDNTVRDRAIELNGFVQNRRDAVAENVERVLRSSSTETTASSAENGSQETFSALLRFRMPHPWIKKARLQRAAAEITLAEAQYLAEEDKLVRDVRALFLDLSVKQSTLDAHLKRRDNFNAYRIELDDYANAKLGENVDTSDFVVDGLRTSIDISGVLEDSLKAGNDVDETRFALARLCGIRDAGRIRSPGIITRRVIDLSSLSQPYLVEMAMLYRSDAVESRGRFGIAKARLAEAKAAKIPWATFIDAGYTRQWRDGYSGAEDEWMIRVGFEIPFFDWTRINKRDREYRKAALIWEEQFDLQRQRVETDVALALNRVSRAYGALYAYDEKVKKEQATIKQRIEKSETVLSAAGAGISGFAKGLRMKQDAEDARQILQIGRYRAYFDYNRSLIELEEAIGIRLEKVLSGRYTK